MTLMCFLETPCNSPFSSNVHIQQLVPSMSLSDSGWKPCSVHCRLQSLRDRSAPYSMPADDVNHKEEREEEIEEEERRRDLYEVDESLHNSNSLFGICSHDYL